MKVFLMSLSLALFSIGAQADSGFKSNETIKILVDQDALTCRWEEIYSHGGPMSFPMAHLLTNEIQGTHFEHNHFRGQANTPTDFSCNPLNALLAQADGEGRIAVQKSINVYRYVYQDRVGGPITAIETSEVVRLTLPNGTYLTSTKSVTEKK